MSYPRGLNMGLNISIPQFIESLNDLNCYLLYFPEENHKQLDQVEIIEIIDKDNAPEWHESMFNANIDIFEMSYEESVSNFKSLENLEMIRRTIGPNASSLPVDIKKSVISSVGKPSMNHKGSNMWYHYCDKNTHNMADCIAIAKFKQQKKACFEAKARPRKKSLAFLALFKEINALKRKLKPEKTANSKERKAESILSTEINSITSSDEGEEYLFTSSQPFSSNKTDLTKSSHPTTNH
jgi:hypothetical protein